MAGIPLILRSKECLQLFPPRDFELMDLSTSVQFVEVASREDIEQVVSKGKALVLVTLALLNPGNVNDLLIDIRAIAQYQHVLIVVLCSPAANTAQARLQCLREGAHVMSENVTVVQQCLKLLRRKENSELVVSSNTFTCPVCSIGCLADVELEQHYNLFHSRAANALLDCPVCSKSSPCLGVHLRECHVAEHDVLPCVHPCRLFAWVVVRDPKTDRYLLVNEPTGLCRNKGPLYWLPAGQLDVGESFSEAAVREVREEAGIDVRLTGILRFIGEKGIVFSAEPCHEMAELKEIPDFESMCAAWVPLPEVMRLPPASFRDTDPLELFPLLDSGHSCPFVEKNSAFTEYEATVQQITERDAPANDNGEHPPALQAKFEALKDVYPSHLFHAFY